LVLLAGGGFAFYSQIESGGVSITGSTNQTSPNIQKRQVQDIEHGTFAYVKKLASTDFKQFKMSDQSTSSVQASSSQEHAGSRSDVFQLSANGLVNASLSANSLIVKSGDNEQSLFEGQTDSIQQWLLIPDGTRIFALVGGDLVSYDTSTGEGGKVAEKFVPIGNDLSWLSYSRDGVIKLFSRDGITLRSAVYDLKTAKANYAEHTVRRLDGVDGFLRDSLSPDGTVMVLPATINDSKTLQILSLNSYILRTIYLADVGNQPTQFSWSIDSNNLVVVESGASNKLVTLKVGTLEKKIIHSSDLEMSNPLWSPNKLDISFVESNTLKSISLDSNEVLDMINDVSQSDFVGWHTI